MLDEINAAIDHHGWNGWKATDDGNGRVKIDSPEFGNFVYNTDGQNISIVIANISSMCAIARDCHARGMAIAFNAERDLVMRNLRKVLFDRR